MKLIGYSKPVKENSFAIPIYTNGDNEFFFHRLNLNYGIVGFTKTILKTETLKKIYLSKNFELGLKGAIVFVGNDGYLKYDNPENAIDEIINYINDTLDIKKHKTILKEANTIKKKSFSDRFNIQNFKVKMNPEEEKIVLTFDFPSVKKESFKIQNDLNITEKEIAENDLKQTTNPSYNSIYEYLTRVDMNVELSLKLRANERRSKLKIYNYQFKVGKNMQGKLKSNE